MTGNGDVHDALASHASDHEVRRELHAVPPHAVYEVVVDGVRAVCKVTRGPEADPATEARVLRYVGRETSIPVPPVLGVGDRYFVAEWCDDVPGGVAGESDVSTIDPPAARTMGEGLATLHTETAFDWFGSFTTDDDGLVLEPAANWSDALCRVLDDCRDFLEPYGHADVACEAIRFLRARPDALAGAGDPVLVHGNFLCEHVGVRDGAVARVIDFEHALVGSGEYDYWATAIPTFGGANAPGGDAELAAFRAGYESVRPLPDGFDRRADVYRAVLSVTYLRSLYLQRRWDSRAEADRRADRFAGYVRETLAPLWSGRE